MGKLPTCSEYLAAIETPQLHRAEILKGGNIIKRNGTTIRYAGGFCVVFPYQTATKKYAIRCWHANIADAQQRTRLIAQELSQCNLPYFVGFEYIADGLVTNEGIQPIVAMDWVEARPLKDYLSEHIADGQSIRSLAERFCAMVKDLHNHNLSHGDLQHGNILVKDNGDIVLVDYDSMYVPALDGFTDEIKGLEGFQHEARYKNEKLTPKADYFSELVIYTSLIALSKYPQLWEDLNMENTDTLLFSAEDIKSKGSSSIFQILDADDELQGLSDTLKNFMQCSTLEELLPLEKVLVSLVDDISSKWGDNGYKAPIIDNSSIINRIGESWRNTTPPDKTPNTELIRNKW